MADFQWVESDSSYEVLTPDEFLTLLDDAAPGLVADVTIQMCHHWFDLKREAELPRKLKAAGCPVFAERVRRHLLRNAHRLPR